jgi:hypothetical protein
MWDYSSSTGVEYVLEVLTSNLIYERNIDMTREYLPFSLEARGKKQVMPEQ